MRLDSTRYLRTLAVVVAVGVVLAVAFVYVVDPYGLYRLINQSGFNRVKPGLGRYQAEIKLTHAARLRPDALILGHSRAEIGFDPNSEAFVRRHLTPYNLAIPGSDIATAREQIDYLYEIGLRPKVIVLGVEFLDYLEAQPAGLTPAPAVSVPRIKRMFWRFDSLFSLTSIKDSVRTLRIQHDLFAERSSDAGFNPLTEYQLIARKDGYFSMFRQRELENAKHYVTLSRARLSDAGMIQLRTILSRGAIWNSETILIIYPYHAQIMAMFAAAGLMPAFDRWKELLVAEVAEAQQRNPSAKYAVYDFSGYGGYRCERIPVQGDLSAATQWYWEAGHFKKALGDVVLSQVLNTDKSASDREFGTLLTLETLRGNQMRISNELTQCAASYPQLFTQSATTIQAAQIAMQKGR